jgi:hypothetical protein
MASRKSSTDEPDPPWTRFRSVFASNPPSSVLLTNEVYGLVSLGGSLLLDILLMRLEQLRAKLDVARLVDTVHVTESGSDAEVWGYGRKRLVDLVDVFGLSVEGVVVN